ncbi:hypothetical protein RDABS01_040143 [Bienertia sinuspersici]
MELFNGVKETELWKEVWRLEGPPKLKHFVWRVCKGSLPVRERLCHRHVSSNSECQVCSHRMETIMHALFECSYARQAWGFWSLNDLLSEAPVTSFAEIFMWLVDKLNKNEIQQFASLCWAIWFCRNRFLFEQKDHDAVRMAARFVELTAEYCTYSARVGGGRDCHMLSNVDWVTPPEGVVKVNVDAHIKATGGGGLSVVIRDHARVVLGAAVRRLEGQWGAKVAEAAAVSYGVSLAYRLGFKKVVLESDAASVVNAISRS